MDAHAWRLVRLGGDEGEVAAGTPGGHFFHHQRDSYSTVIAGMLAQTSLRFLPEEVDGAEALPQAANRLVSCPIA